MQKFSSSYANTNCNYVILNNEDYYNTVPLQYKSIYCVLQNIIQRGNPSKPSDWLIEQLGCFSDCSKAFTISNCTPIWKNTIKGDEILNYNPAKIFFYDIIPEYLKDLAFVQKLIIPEMLIEDILPSSDQKYIDQSVDFYLPQAKMIIEIDGYQHQFDRIQVNKDINRDQYFKKQGFHVYRISTDDIKNRTAQLSITMREIFSQLSEYKKIDYFTKSVDIEPNRIKYDIVMRYQILLLQLLQNGRISIFDKNWNFFIIDQEQDTTELFRIAYEDLFIWLKHLFALNHIDYIKPKLLLNMDRSKSITVNFSYDQKWTDEHQENIDMIYIRNDYMDDLDYFKVVTTKSIKYNIDPSDTSNDTISLKFILKNIFGYDSFRDGQLPIIINSLNKNDTIGILPTGAGKSLCYQIVAILQPCISFVVCPIISLIYDQKENLDEFGITHSAYITSDLTAMERDNVLNQYKKCKYQLIWISPERFQSQKFRDVLTNISYTNDFGVAVIDEVHCLSEWGHDFRTSYLCLVKTIKKCCPSMWLLGLTATASSFVLEDLKREFNISSENVKTITKMSRSELHIDVINLSKSKTSRYDQLKKLISQIDSKYEEKILIPNGKDSKCGIIFTIFKGGPNGCKQIAESLSNDMNVPVLSYHGDLGESKKRVQKQFIDNKNTLLVATKSFGMGVNKPNIRYTIHYGLPWSIESFYQEAGRAGRDNQDSFCYILYTPENCPDLNTLFELQTTQDDIIQYQKNLKHDLSDIFYLWSRNHHNLKYDLKMLCMVMHQLTQSQDGVFTCSEQFPKYESEKALYQLSILGVVDDWTIDSWTNRSEQFRVYLNEFSVESIKDNLENYIKRYDPDFSFHSDKPRYAKYIDVLCDNTLSEYAKYMKILLMWSNDNIVYQRRQAIKNMMDLCDHFTTGEEMARFIDNYFAFTDRTIVLDNIAYQPSAYLNWFTVFYDISLGEDLIPIKRICNTDELEAIYASTQRYLESYRYNTGLNYINGILRILLRKDEHEGDLSRFEDALSEILTFPASNQEDIIQETIHLAQNSDNDIKAKLGMYLSRYYPNFAKMIYLQLQDPVSLLISIQPMVKELKTALEELK